MWAYLREYRCIAKAGLLHASHSVIIGVAIFMFLFGKYLGLGLEVLIFILTPMGYMLDLDTNKYVMNYSLPISMKRRLHLLYGFTIISSFLSVSMVNLRFYLEGISRSLTISILIFLLNIIGCNLYYALFCSQEFKKDVLDMDSKQAAYQAIIGGIIGISIAVRFRVRLQITLEQFIESLGSIPCYILIGGLLIFTIWWTRKSMQLLERVVRHKTMIDKP